MRSINDPLMLTLGPKLERPKEQTPSEAKAEELKWFERGDFGSDAEFPLYDNAWPFPTGCIEVIEGAKLPPNAVMLTPEEVDAFFEAFWSHQGA